MALQGRIKVGYEQKYPGSYAWPIYEVLCPECGKWVKEYGEVDQQDADGDWHCLCIPCGDKVMPATE